MSGIRRQLGLVTLAAALLYAPAVFAADAGPAATAGADSESASFEATLTQSRSPEGPIHAGETVAVTLRVDHPAGAAVELPESYEPSRWVLIDVDSASTSREGNASSTWVAEFGIYRPGKTTLEPFDVRIVTRDGTEASLTTDPVTVKVLSRFADAETEPEFLDPRGPVEVWVEDMTLAWVGGGAALAAVLGLFLFLAARREAMRPEPPPPPREPHEIALEKLGALAADDLVERGEYMIFWVRLSEAIREYLGRRYGFAPTELTTSEILYYLDPVRWPPGLDLEDIAEFLRRCDRVKFAGYRPTVEESSQALRRGFSIVELTRPASSRTDEEEPTEPAQATAPSEPDPEIAEDEPTRNRWAPPSERDRSTGEEE